MKNTKQKAAQAEKKESIHTGISDELQNKRSILLVITWLYTKIKKIFQFIIIVVKRLFPKTKELSLKFYTITEIPLYNFLKCLCESDYIYLYKVVPKKRNTEKEAEHFADLLFQYSEQMDGKSIGYQNIKKIVSLLAKIRILESSLCLISKRKDNAAEGLKTVLKSYGIRLTEDKNKNILIVQGKIDFFVREYNNLIEKVNEKENKKTEINQYIEILAAMSTHFKLRLNIYEITVAEFISYYKLFTKEIESLKKLNKKGYGSGKH